MRLSKKSIRSVPWVLRPFFWHQKRKYGQYLEPAKVWAQVPLLFIAVSSLVGIFNRKKSPLNGPLRALISIRVSQLNGCRFCVDLNSALYLQRKGLQEKYEQLEHWQTSLHYCPEEKAALDYAEHMTLSNQPVTTACFDALKEHYTEQQIIELTALIAFQNMSSKFNSALDIEPQGMCKRPNANSL